MRPVITSRVTTTLAVIAAAAGVSGCDKLTPNGATGTIALLHAGSEQACVAKEVQDDLRGLIVPKAAEFGSDVAPENLDSAIGGTTITFDTTTLQAVDKPVNKVSCVTNAEVGGLGDPRRFRITYDVSPSAENPSSVVVSADTTEAKAYTRSAIDNGIAHLNAAKAQEEEAAKDEQARQQLLATITPKWLVGSWIANGADASQCSNGQALTFQPDHRVEGSRISGNWSLEQDRLHANGEAASGGAELDGTITQADELSFALLTSSNNTLMLRRCTRDEVSGTAVLPVGIGDQPERGSN